MALNTVLINQSIDPSINLPFDDKLGMFCEVIGSLSLKKHILSVSLLLNGAKDQLNFIQDTFFQKVHCRISHQPSTVKDRKVY